MTEQEAYSDMRYLEESMKHLVKELKKNNCLSQDFKFLTKAERELALERVIEHFIGGCQDLRNQR